MSTDHTTLVFFRYVLVPLTRAQIAELLREVETTLSISFLQKPLGPDRSQKMPSTRLSRVLHAHAAAAADNEETDTPRLVEWRELISSGKVFTASHVCPCQCAPHADASSRPACCTSCSTRASAGIDRARTSSARWDKKLLR